MAWGIGVDFKTVHVDSQILDVTKSGFDVIKHSESKNSILQKLYTRQILGGLQTVTTVLAVDLDYIHLWNLKFLS